MRRLTCPWAITRPARPFARGRAFTLVETMLALAVVTALLGSMFAFLSSVLSRADETRSAIAKQRGVDVFFADVERSLATTFVGARGDQAGVQGTGTSLLIRGRGTIADAGQLLDLRGSEYRYRGGVIEGRRWGGPRPTGGTEEEWSPIAMGVEGVRLRYFDGKTWASTFASYDAGKLPWAIEVAVWMGTPDETDEGETASSASEPESPRRAPDRVTTFAVPDAGGGA